jgi:hypothetical protein
MARIGRYAGAAPLTLPRRLLDQRSISAQIAWAAGGVKPMKHQETLGFLPVVFRLVVGIVLLCGFAGPAVGASPVTRVGNEFQANSTTFLWQREPAVAALSNGRFVIVWTDESKAAPDTSGRAIRMRSFSHGGTPLGGDSIVNAQRNLDQDQPAVVALDGSYVVVWADSSGAGADRSGSAIRGRRLTNAGVKVGSEFQVNHLAAGDQDTPALAALSQSRLVAAYENAADGMRGQIFSGGGARVGNEFRIDSTDTVAAPFPAVAQFGAGFVIAWTGVREIPGQRGSPTIVARRFNADAERVGGEVVVNTTQPQKQENPAAARLSDSRCVVVWQDGSEAGGDTDGFAVRAQVVSAGGKVGPQILVPTRRAGDQFEPAVAAFANGRFVVVWTDRSASPDDPSGSAVRGQVFSPAGAKLGSEFRVNRRTNGNQETAAVAVFDNRDFVVVWTDSSFLPPDQSTSGIRGQVFRLEP